MIFQNILFHNVEELIPTEDGWAISRLPADLREMLTRRNAGHVAVQTTGVELRFRIRSGEAKIYLRKEPDTSGTPAQIMYGSFQGGWPVSNRTISTNTVCISLRASEHIEALERITQKQGLIFNPNMIRILLPSGKCRFLGAEGDIEPPHPEDQPSKRMLSHGSSITHGSLAMGSLQCYASRLAGAFGCDSINLGLAGNCHLEREVAEYIVRRKDWNICTVEMGINMLNFDEGLFRERVHNFVEIMSKETRPVFTCGIMHHNENKPNTQRFREILREETEGKLPHINGLELLHEPGLIAEDMVHPALFGHELIAGRWADAIRREIGK